MKTAKENKDNEKTTTKEQKKTKNYNKQKIYIPKLRGTVCDSVSDARDGRGGDCCRRWGRLGWV